MRPIHILSGIVFLALAFLSVTSFYTVDEGERAVIITQGKIVGVSEPGFHWKWPFITEAHTVSLRDGLAQYENIEAYTRDAQTATIHKVSREG
ncbi:SPFH domain-containing protein [Phyllobacterium myrsinacearum]|uniref:Regulator of protease activity HflC (Stomatin/prohibitin superfamily) n=1 Tax=Phyllobacterium myrsinacearum TaxID=28101 RepID=A0A839ETZ2_9HYPH|nr:SPFH domain-containing protein [Phyllobacterium myrsinacearum]MBA8881648.1 regulator of protease activity HflC (stomatin/prohibitin superfamily) [Phyllobacterium myrsinacearum]